MNSINELAPNAIAYEHYRYVYPPRPTLKTPPSRLHVFDEPPYKGQYVAQPKLNGSNCLVFIRDEYYHTVMDRHNKDWTNKVKLDFKQLHRGKGWMVLNGEWMEKSAQDEYGDNFNGNFVIFDILVYDGYILAGSTFADRINLLAELYPHARISVSDQGEFLHHKYLYTTEIEHVYRVITYTTAFKKAFDLFTQIPMMEGVVLKKREQRLLAPFTERANHLGMIKSRREHANYKH